MTDSAGTLPSGRQFISVTISTAANGLSGAINVGGGTLAAIQMPATWTAAGMTFQASIDGDTFNSVYGSTGNEINYTVAANRIITFDPAFWLGLRQIKIRSGTSGTPVAQAAERSLVAIVQALGAIK